MDGCGTDTGFLGKSCMMVVGSQEKIEQVVQACLPMKKLDIATLRKAY